MSAMDMNSDGSSHKGCERLSCLADGELDAVELDAVLSEMAPEEVSECWHAYQLIGDVLRTPGLASSRCDAQWLAQLRQRLQAESAGQGLPVARVGGQPDIEATRQRPAANDGVFRWKMVAGLASFAAVAAVGWNLLGTLQPASVPAAAVLAQNERPQPAAEARNVALNQGQALQRFWSPAQPPYTMVLRNPELDRMLAQQAGSNPDPSVQRASEFFAMPATQAWNAEAVSVSETCSG